MRKKHARLNCLLQSAGAMVCKRWALLTNAALQTIGLRPRLDYEIYAFVHDEMVLGARNQEIAEIIKEVGTANAVINTAQIMPRAIKKDW